MKMIDVLSLMAEGKIKKDTKLIVYDGSEEYSYRYSEICRTFFDEYSSRIECDFDIDEDFLNLEVELIEPKPKEYLVKLNVQGLYEGFAYLNYFVRRNQVRIHDEFDNEVYKTHFTKDELQSIQPVKEFLEDTEGKYELIEVEECD